MSKNEIDFKAIGFILTAVVLAVFAVVVFLPQEIWVNLSMKLFP